MSEFAQFHAFVELQLHSSDPELSSEDAAMGVVALRNQVSG